MVVYFCTTGYLAPLIAVFFIFHTNFANGASWPVLHPHSQPQPQIQSYNHFTPSHPVNNGQNFRPIQQQQQQPQQQQHFVTVKTSINTVKSISNPSESNTNTRILRESSQSNFNPLQNVQNSTIINRPTPTTAAIPSTTTTTTNTSRIAYKEKNPESTLYKIYNTSASARTPISAIASAAVRREHQRLLQNFLFSQAQASANGEIRYLPPSLSNHQVDAAGLNGLILNPNFDLEQQIAGQQHQHHHNSHMMKKKMEDVSVSCERDKMIVRIAFGKKFDGIVYAKGYYSDPRCRFVLPRSGKQIYNFDMNVGECGVGYVDAGLKTGGFSYIEGLIIINTEPGVHEAWDSAKVIQCIWEGTLEKNITTGGLGIQSLEAEPEKLRFRGDHGEISSEFRGRTVDTPVVEGIVKIGQHLTMVILARDDPEFDMLVKNCYATDGGRGIYPSIQLVDDLGCPTRPKFMGGWKTMQENRASIAFAHLSVFKFPELDEIFFECMVTLCKGTCEKCPNFKELEGYNGRDDDIDSANLRPHHLDERLKFDDSSSSIGSGYLGAFSERLNFQFEPRKKKNQQKRSIPEENQDDKNGNEDEIINGTVNIHNGPSKRNIKIRQILHFSNKKEFQTPKYLVGENDETSFLNLFSLAFLFLAILTLIIFLMNLLLLRIFLTKISKLFLPKK